jgi:hypothetical protein
MSYIIRQREMLNIHTAIPISGFLFKHNSNISRFNSYPLELLNFDAAPAPAAPAPAPAPTLLYSKAKFLKQTKV